MAGPFRNAHIAALNKTLKIINAESKPHPTTESKVDRIVDLIDKIFAKREGTPVKHSLVWIEAPSVPTRRPPRMGGLDRSHCYGCRHMDDK